MAGTVLGTGYTADKGRKVPALTKLTFYPNTNCIEKTKKSHRKAN